MRKTISILLVSLLALSMLTVFSTEVKAQDPPEQLTTNPYKDSNPSWSPDGTKIAFTSFSGSWYRNIWTMNSDGSGKTQITFGNAVNEQPSYSPDGSKMVFEHWGYRGDYCDLMVMNADGTGIERITFGGIPGMIVGTYFEPQWSQDGSRLIFAYGEGTTGQYKPLWICTMNSDGSGIEVLERGLNPRFCYDDTKILFTHSIDPYFGDMRIALMNADGTGLEYLTDGPLDYEPDMSPLSNQIVFTRGWNVGDLYLMDTDGSNLDLLMSNGLRNFEACWSPDGEYIAFSSGIIGVDYNIFKLKVPTAHAPVGHWRFDEGSGTIASDSSGNGNTGTLINGPLWVDGVSGSALSFDGIDDFVQVPNSPSLTVSGDEISVELWFKPAITLDGNSHPVNFVGKGLEYVIQFEHDYDTGELLYDGELTFAIALQPSETNWATVRSTTKQWMANVWYYVAGTYDGNYLRIYVNGVLENSASVSGNLFAQGTDPLGIGSHYLGDWPYEPWSHYFTGVIDEVAVYNSPRTAEEIWNDYTSLKPSRPDKGEPRGVFVRLSQLCEISEYGKQTVTRFEVERAIESFVEHLTSNKINTIFVGFKDDGASFDSGLAEELPEPIGYEDPGYASGILMYDSTLYANMVYGPFQLLRPFDPMAYLIEKAHEKQIEVHAWMPVFRDYLGAHPTRLSLPLQPSEAGKTVVEFVDPDSSTVKTYFFDIMSEIVTKYDLEGINLDYIRTDENALGQYKGTMQQVIVDFVSGVKTSFPNHVLSADVLSWNIEDTKSGVAQDYVSISKYVEALMPMTYFAASDNPAYREPPSWVGDRVAYFRSLTYSRYITPIIQAFHHRVNNQIVHLITKSQVIQAIETARANNADGFSLFNYISIRDDLGEIALDEICEMTCTEEAVPSWQLQVEFETDAETYWMIFPTIDFWGSFHWRTCRNPLVNKPITISIRTPPTKIPGEEEILVPGRWLDFQLHGFTGDDGGFIGQLSGIAMWPGEWLLRVKDETYGAAAIETFEVKILPGNLLFIAFSPVDVHVYDSEGRHVGANETGGVDIEIPGAFYSGPETEPEFILVPNPMQGEYNLILLGTATGNYTLTIEYTTADQTASQTFQGTITLNEQQYYSTMISETEEMTAISWEQVFKDPKRGTMIKVSTDDKYFQFTAPDKDFGIKYDANMKVFNHIITICYEDSEMRILAIVVDDDIHFCSALVWDKQTNRLYVLIDKPDMTSTTAPVRGAGYKR